MNFPPQMQLQKNIELLDEAKILPAPDWVKTEIWLGWFCRWWQMPGACLVLVAILPTRDLAAVFSGLGCIFAGAHKFEGGFTWEELVCSAAGTPYFCLYNNQCCQVKVTGTEDIENNSLVNVKFTSGPKNLIGAEIGVTNRSFSQFRFTKEKTPATRGREAIKKTWDFIRLLGLNPQADWQWSVGAEACTITKRTRYRNSMEGISLSAGDSGPAVPLKDLINPADMGDIHMAKLRLETTRRHVTDKFPTLILDGKEAFNHVRAGVSSRNILILLDRSEFNSEIRDMLLEWNNYSLEPANGMVESLPDLIPPEIELSALILPDT